MTDALLQRLFAAADDVKLLPDAIQWRGRVVPRTGGIYRFRQDDGYNQSFAMQWKKFQREQYDDINGTTLSRDRIAAATRWNLTDLRGELILEAGCGAGRFTRLLAQSGAELVTFDYSSAVEVSHEMNHQFPNVTFLQSDIFDMPFRDGAFDRVFCYGVLQHTPDPEQAFYRLAAKVRPGGRISVDIYPRDFKIRPSKSKYLWRWLTTRMDKERLMRLLQWYIPRWLPWDTRIKRIPKIGKYLGSVIPCWNYFYTSLTPEDQVRWAIMDTFDALAPQYDKPAMKSQVQRWFERAGLTEIDVRRGSNGILGNGVKPA